MEHPRWKCLRVCGFDLFEKYRGSPGLRAVEITGWPMSWLNT